MWSVLTQFDRLLETVRAGTASHEKQIFVAHVSPGKEPLLTLIGAHLHADLIVSGHMGPPTPMVWNEFAIREPQEAVDRLEARLKDVEASFNRRSAAAQQSLSHACLGCGISRAIPRPGRFSGELVAGIVVSAVWRIRR